MTLSDAFFQALPKVDIHCHLYGTIREETLWDMVQQVGAPISRADVAGYFIRGEKPKGVLHAFRFMEEHVFTRPEFLHRLTYECLEDMARETVLYCELFWNSTGVLAHQPQLSFEVLQAAITDAMQQAERDLGIVARLVHAIDRQATPEDAVTMVQNALTHCDARAVGIGADYLETGHPPEKFWKAYRMARAGGLKTTMHAGEFGCHWRNVETAFDLLEVDRLDHCYTIIDNPDLLARVAQSGIVVTVVPTNSYYLRTLAPSDWAEKHPLRRMLASELKLHPNTDDPTFHNITPAGVWAMMHRDFGVPLAQIEAMTWNGLESAWIEGEERAALTRIFEREWQTALTHV
ncbi:adenosine deaminase family protein [Thalassorhabdomicrobium marinisediminis]|uniref:Adenosine deaminase n=1 Tax=Thalassorhabdomicrobium marinisediminis TaxID=2170577 RepID=A0A2T7FX83_9RHOB|nr:adenosine deaminase [Thalassorhabdomicrobium marinisediminis]PVA06779.1 adenosine deaminase [Thalassorhabdomicrobium marinisediminis]